MKIKIGIAQGRFHIIHWGHIEYLLKAKEVSEHLVIGVTDCDPERAYFEYSEDIKNFDQNNLLKPYRSFDLPIFPFTFYDRAQMIKRAIIDEGVNPSEFDIVPFPIHTPNILKYYIPLDGVILATIYDEWGERKIDIFKKMGFNVQILWRRGMETRFTTGSEVRRRIKNGENWKNLVPDSVHKYISEKNIIF